MAVVAAARSAALSKNLFIYIAIDSSFVSFRKKASFTFIIKAWRPAMESLGTGGKGVKALFTFLPFYFFAFEIV